MLKSLLKRNLPIVGQPCAVFEAQISTIVLCNCHEDNVPFLVNGVDTIKQCPRCGEAYVIMCAEFDRRRGDTFVKVSVSPLRLAQPREN